jgi:hypothetical protein
MTARRSSAAAIVCCYCGRTAVYSRLVDAPGVALLLLAYFVLTTLLPSNVLM